MGFLNARFEIGFFAHNSHAAPAAAHRRFNDHGIADFRRDFLRFRNRLNRILSARQNRNTRRLRQPPGRSFIPEQFQQVRSRANERYPRFVTSSRKRRILR